MTASANQFGQWTVGQYTRFSGGTEYANVSQTFTADDRIKPPQWPQWEKPTLVQRTPPPVQVLRYVNTASTAGGDGTTNATAGANRAYATLNEALTGLQSTNWADARQQLTILCEGTAADTTAVAMSTTWLGKLSPDCYLEIIGDQPSSTAYSTSNYRIELASGTTLFSMNGGDYVRISKIGIKQLLPTGAGGYTMVNVADRTPALGSADIRLERIYAWLDINAGRSASASGFRVAMLAGSGGRQVSLSNCLARLVTTSTPNHVGYALDPATCDVVCYDCEAIDFPGGFNGSATVTAKGCGVSGSGHGTTPGFGATWNAASTNNASNQADAPGSNPRNSVTPTFVNAAAGDFHLSASDTAWIDRGIDLSADSRYPVAIDGDGVVRVGTPDIGADELAVSYTLAADAGSYAITGAAAALRTGYLVAATAGSYAETGAAASLRVGRLVAATAGSYAISGGAARVTATRLVPAVAGVYTITGAAARTAKGYKVPAVAGVYTETGAAASLRVGHVVAALAGAYAISGGSARLTLGHVVLGSAGVYTITGAAADLVYTPTANNYVIAANAGAYTITGADAWVARSLLGQSSAGAYAETGDDALLAVGRVLSADAGIYAETGADASLVVFTGNFILDADAGVYGITGADAFLRAIQQGTGGGGTTIAGIVGIPFEVERRRKREPEPEAEAEPEVAAAEPEPEIAQAPAVAVTEAAAEVVEVAAVSEPEAVAVAPVAPQAPEPPAVEVSEAEVERAIEAREQLEALELIERQAMAAAEIAEPEPEIELQLETEAELAPEVRIEAIAPVAEPVAEIAEPEVQEVAPEPAIVVQPSPVTVTIQAATPQEAAAELVRQIEQPRGTFTAADMAALALAMTIALED